MRVIERAKQTQSHSIQRKKSPEEFERKVTIPDDTPCKLNSKESLLCCNLVTIAQRIAIVALCE